MKQRASLRLAGLCLALAAGVSSAADDGPVVLRGLQVDAELQRLSDRVSTREVVDRGEIERSGASDLADVLRDMNGVFIRVGGDGTPRVDVRGLRTRQVLFLLDGVPMNAAADGQFDPRRVPAGIISRVEVIRGASSVLYGPNGAAGVINIVTREADPGLGGEVRAEAGPEGYRLLELAGGWQGERSNLFIAGGLETRDGFPLSDDFEPTSTEDGDRRENSDFERANLLAGYDLALTERTRLGVIAEVSEGEFGRPPTTRDRSEDPYGGRVRYERVEDFDGRTLQTVLHHRTRGGAVIRPRVYYNVVDELSHGFDDDTYSTQQQRRSFTESVELRRRGADLRTTMPMGAGGSLGFAGGWSDERWLADGFEVKRSGRSTIDNDYQASTTYLSAELEHPLGERIEGFAGIGWSERRRDGGDDNGDVFYSGGLLVDLSQSTLLRLVHGRQIRHPNLRDLYAVDRANPELESERIRHYEVGVDQSLPFWSGLLSVSAFQADARDFITRDENGVSQNLQRLRFRGIETAVSLHPVERLFLRVRYTFLDSEDLDPAPDGSRELQNRPRHRVGVESGYRWRTGTGVRAAWGYTADNLTLDRDGNSRAIGDYRVLDFTLYQSLLGDQVRLYVRAENLLDEDYEPGYGFPGPGRRVFGGFRVRL